MKPQPRTPTRRLARGTSIVETLCALAVLAVATGTAVPRYQKMRDDAALAGTASALEADIQHARSEAALLGQPVRLTLGDSVGGSCMMVHLGDAEACRCTDSQAPQCEGDARLLRATVIPARERAQLRSAVRSILFDADRGTTTPTATVRVVAPDGRAIHAIVNLLGRVRSCSPGAQVAGFKAC